MKKIVMVIMTLVLTSCYYLPAPDPDAFTWFTYDNPHKFVQHFLCVKQHYGEGRNNICQADIVFTTSMHPFRIHEPDESKHRWLYNEQRVGLYLWKLAETDLPRLDKLIRDYYATRTTSLEALLDESHYTGQSIINPNQFGGRSTIMGTPDMVQVYATLRSFRVNKVYQPRKGSQLEQNSPTWTNYSTIGMD